MNQRITEDEMRSRFERGSHSYKGYEIKAKRDYADVLAYDRGFYLRDGFVVTKGIVNVMPGAVWFNNLDAARNAIDILDAVGEADFWPAYERVKTAMEDARQQALASLANSSY